MSPTASGKSLSGVLTSEDGLVETPALDLLVEMGWAHAIFDLLTKPKPKLTKAQDLEVKKVARELLEKLEDQLAIAEWQTKQQTRTAVQSTFGSP